MQNGEIEKFLLQGGMANMYEIKVLSNDEFDNVAASDDRYSYVDDSNLGFADKQKGIAYVRQTNIHDLNKYLINHELEELDAENSTHEDTNGIRHKKVFKEGIVPTWTGYNPSQGDWSFVGASNTGPGERKDETSGNQGLNQPQIAFPQQQQPQTVTVGAAQPGALGQFSQQGPASSRVPESVTGSTGGSLGGGLGQFGQGEISPEVLERLKGFYGGRLTF